MQMLKSALRSPFASLIILCCVYRLVQNNDNVDTTHNDSSLLCVCDVIYLLQYLYDYLLCLYRYIYAPTGAMPQSQQCAA